MSDNHARTHARTHTHTHTHTHKQTHTPNERTTKQKHGKFPHQNISFVVERERRKAIFHLALLLTTLMQKGGSLILHNSSNPVTQLLPLERHSPARRKGIVLRGGLGPSGRHFPQPAWAQGQCKLPTFSHNPLFLLYFISIAVSVSINTDPRGEI